MKIYDKFIKKYGTDTVLLPPPLEEEVIETELPADPKVPHIPELSEEEMGKFFNIRYDPEEAGRIREYLEKIKNIQEDPAVNMSGSSDEEMAGGEKQTRPGGRKSNYPTRFAFPQSEADLVLQACDAYFHLTTKK